MNLAQLIIQFKFLNNTNFIFRFIGGINITTNAIFKNIRIVHTLRSDWLYRVSVLIYLECPYYELI